MHSRHDCKRCARAHPACTAALRVPCGSKCTFFLPALTRGQRVMPHFRQESGSASACASQRAATSSRKGCSAAAAASTSASRSAPSRTTAPCVAREASASAVPPGASHRTHSSSRASPPSARGAGASAAADGAYIRGGRRSWQAGPACDGPLSWRRQRTRPSSARRAPRTAAGSASPLRRPAARVLCARSAGAFARGPCVCFARAMGSRAKLYAVVGAGSVTGMFTARELLQRGGNVRCVMRDPERYKAELEEMIAYFPRGKRGNMEYCAADVTKPETLPAGAPARRGVALGACGLALVGECALRPRGAPSGAAGRARRSMHCLRCAAHALTWRMPPRFCALQRSRGSRRSSFALPAPPGWATAGRTTSTSWRVPAPPRLACALPAHCARCRAARAAFA